MSAEQFVGFLQATGHRVLRTASAYWYDASPWFFLSTPSHHQIAPSAEEIREVLGNRPCLGVRFPAPLNGPGKLSYQIVCDMRGYGIERLGANSRSKVRRGLRRCEVGPISFAEIAAQGRLADHDTVARQRRRTALNGERWARYWRAAAQTPGMEGWAASVSGELVAFLVSVQFGDTVEFMLARSRSDRLDAYPNNALIYRVAEEMLVKRGLREITFGLESLESVGPLDQFKFSMGFHPRPLRQRVVFHPAVSRVLQWRALRSACRRLAEHQGRRVAFWRKAAGLLRFAEEGGL